MKRLGQLIAREFAPILEAAGFSRIGGLSFVRRIPDVRELHVDIRDHKYRAGFSVTLQDLSWDGKQARVRSLERLVGLQHYRYDPNDESSLQTAVNVAAKHLRDFGLEWLINPEAGNNDLRGSAGSLQHRYDDLLREARTAFKLVNMKRRSDCSPPRRQFENSIRRPRNTWTSLARERPKNAVVAHPKKMERGHVFGSR